MAQCCPGLPAGAQLYANDAAGIDAACCGSVSAPCNSLTQTMNNLVAANVIGGGIIAAHGAGANFANWSSDGDIFNYPVHLGMGVTLSAPGLTFSQNAQGTFAFGFGANPVFLVAPYPAEAGAPGTVSIQGAPGNPIYVGIDLEAETDGGGAVYTVANALVGIVAQGPLDLADVFVGGSSTGISIQAGGNVTVSGQVNVGFAGAPPGSPELPTGPATGIACQGMNSGSGMATLTDTAGAALAIGGIGLRGTDLAAVDYCNVTLQQPTVFGSSRLVVGVCPWKTDHTGVSVDNHSIVSLTGPTIECIYDDAVDVGTNSTSGLPVINLTGGVIAHAGCSGLYATGNGTIKMGGGQIENNYYGAIQDSNGLIHFGVNPPSGDTQTIVGCNTNFEDGACFDNSMEPGVDVWNRGTQPIRAQNVAWDHLPPTQDLACGFGTPGACGLSDGEDLVCSPSVSNGTCGGVVTAGATQSSTGCQ